MFPVVHFTALLEKKKRQPENSFYLPALFSSSLLPSLPSFLPPFLPHFLLYFLLTSLPSLPPFLPSMRDHPLCQVLFTVPTIIDRLIDSLLSISNTGGTYGKNSHSVQQGREPATNPIHVRHQVRDINPRIKEGEKTNNEALTVQLVLSG